jgi:hypothetical protein
MIRQNYTVADIECVLREMQANLPSHKYDVGQKVRSELCSKLIEQINAMHFSKKLGISVVPGKADVDPDNLYHFSSGSAALEIKVAQTHGAHNKRVRFRGGKLSNRSSEYLFIARNADCTEFFAALTYMTKADWVVQNTEYYAPMFTEDLLFKKPHVVLWGSFSTETKGVRKGSPVIKLQPL